MTLIEEVAFPRLTSAELALVGSMATPHDYADGEIIFRAGQADIDLFIVESGGIEIQNPMDDHAVIVVHEPGQFSGDIDLLTGRPVIVTAVARGATRVLRVPCTHLRAMLNRVPSFGEKLMTAFTRRREMLSRMGTLGLRVVGPGRCRDTNTVREFLYKNFVPFTWFDTETEQGQRVFAAAGLAKEDAGHRMRQRASFAESNLARAGHRGRHLATLSFARSRSGDRRRWPGRHRRRRVCVVRGTFHIDARPTWTWRPGWRVIAN